MRESRTRQDNHVQAFIESRRKKERYIANFVALHYCRFSNRVLTIKKSHWIQRLDSKIPKTNTRCDHCSGFCWEKSVRGHKRLHYQLPCTLAMPLSPDICHCHTASVISIHSSQMTSWNPRCFTCPSVIPDLRGNMPDSAGCRAELRPYGGMSALPSFQDPPYPHTPCITPDQCIHTKAFSTRPVGRPQGWSFGQCLVSEPTQRTDSFFSSGRTTSLVGTCYRYNPHCLQGNSWACQSWEHHVRPSDALGLLLSYPKGDRDGLIKDGAHNLLLLSKSSLITKWKEIVLHINQYNLI